MVFPRALARHNNAISLGIEPNLMADLLGSFIADERPEGTHRLSTHFVMPSTRYVPP